jgi:SAM-dependent methyltransferase
MWQGYFTICYKDSFEKDSDTIDVKNTSDELIRELRARNFDLVIIPYEGTVNWGDVSLENFIAMFAKQFMIVFPDGRKRLYTRYDDLNRIIYNKAYLGSMFRFVPRQKGKKILHVGCSDGLVCDLLLNESPESIVGIDIMKDVGCNYTDPRIKYARMDASNLAFKNKTFDLCFSIATLEHCRDPFHVLEEMKRVTKKGGYCYVQAGHLYYSPFGHHMF